MGIGKRTPEFAMTYYGAREVALKLGTSWPGFRSGELASTALHPMLSLAADSAVELGYSMDEFLRAARRAFLRNGEMADYDGEWPVKQVSVNVVFRE